MKERWLKPEVVIPEPCITGCGKLAYPGKKCPSCSEVKDPDRCSTCGAKWDWRTDAFGNLHPVHAVTKCVPRVVTFEPDDEPIGVRTCETCRKDFDIYPNQQLKRYCDPCRVERNENRNRQTAQASNERRKAA